MNYIVIITSTNNHFQKVKVFGPFESVEEIREWLKDKYDNWSYRIDIHPVHSP